jgi:hypothetical protein
MTPLHVTVLQEPIGKPSRVDLGSGHGRVMRWVRSHIGLGSRLALFALALQIVVSFGHIHFYGVTPASAESAMSSAPSVTAGGLALPGTFAPVPKSNGSADSNCSICALIRLAATAAPSAPPALWLPVNPGPIGLPFRAATALAASPQFLFRARAPPSI